MSRRANVLHLCETAGIGGAETVMLRLIERLDASRFAPHAVLMRRGWLEEELRHLGLRPSVIPSRPGPDPAFVGRLATEIRRVKADLIHAHLPDALAYACLAGLFTRTPVIGTHHGFAEAHAPASARMRVKFYLARRLTRRAVAVSEALRAELVNRFRFAPDRTRVIYNGIDWASLDGPFDLKQQRSSLQMDAQAPLVGIVANLRPAKGYEVFVEAAARIVRARPSVRFVVVGEEEVGLRSRLDQRVAELGLGDRIRFLGARRDVPRILRMLDIFALSSLSEGMSMATVEAMAAGTPVVVTRSGGPEEIVRDGETGLLVPPGDAGALAQGILRLLADPGLARTLAERARADVRGRFDIRRMVSAYAALYEECLC